MRERRGRTRHTLGRENEVPRIVQRRDEYDKERDITAQVGKTLKAQEEETHILPGYRVVGTGLGVPPEETPIILAQEGRSMKGREVKGEEGRVLVCRCP